MDVPNTGSPAPPANAHGKLSHGAGQEDSAARNVTPQHVQSFEEWVEKDGECMHMLQQTRKDADKPEDLRKLLEWLLKTRELLKKSDEEWEKLREMFDDLTTKEQEREKLARADDMNRQYLQEFQDRETALFAEVLQTVKKKRTEYRKMHRSQREQREESVEKEKESLSEDRPVKAEVEHEKRNGEWSEEKEKLLYEYLKVGIEVRLRLEEEWMEAAVRGAKGLLCVDDSMRMARVKTELAVKTLNYMTVDRLVELELEEMKERPEEQKTNVLYTSAVILDGHPEMDGLMDVLAEKELLIFGVKEKLGLKDRMKQKQRVRELEKMRDMLFEKLERMIAPEKETKNDRQQKKKKPGRLFYEPMSCEL